MPVVDGIVSGIDTTALIDAIVEASAGPKNAMVAQKYDMEQKQDKVAGVKTYLESLLETIKTMDATDEFPSFTIELSSEAAFSASVDAGASPGSFSVEVQSLAKADSWVAAGISDQSATGVITEGSYDIEYAGTTTSITIDSTNSSLSGLASELNDINGVTSYVLDTGESSNPYRLVVTGESTGADNSVDLSTLTDLTWSNTVTAQDAELTVNGVTLYSASNNVQDAVPGVDMSLIAVTTAEVQATVNRDDAAIADKVQAFIDDYNAAVGYYNLHTNWDPDEGIRGAFVGDGTVRGVIGKLGVMVSSQYSLGNTLGALSQVGISTERDGTLALDRTEFIDQLGSYYGDVVELFTEDGGPMGSIRDQLDDVYLDPYEGTLKSRSDSLEESIEDLEISIESFEERLDSLAERLRDQFTNMEIILGELNTTQSYLSSLFSTNE